MNYMQAYDLETLSPLLRRATKVKYVAGETLHGSPQRPLPEAMKVKPGLY